jgi:hypothetical protein
MTFRKTVSKQDAIRHFIFTLGSDFESIQNSYRIDNLPKEWRTDDWPTLLILCQDFYNSLHPNGPNPKKDTHSGDHPFASKQDCLNHQKKIRLWFLNPVKFKNALETEQKKHSGKCVYHLCDNHPTSTCNVKLECNKILSEKQQNPMLGSSSSGHLHHITGELYEDAVDTESNDVESEYMTNDTNEASLHYFACVTNHYLCLSLKARQKLSSNDQGIWNAAYDEEYEGLESLSTWEIISEEHYRLLSKGKRALPTMAIATIKYDANNRPKCAKYRLVVLGNLDYHTWSREATAAPVMSQLELRLLTSLAVFHRRVLKNCDVKQAFIQSTLPEGKEYFLRPPPGCPCSMPGQYWQYLWGFMLMILFTLVRVIRQKRNLKTYYLLLVWLTLWARLDFFLVLSLYGFFILMDICLLA